MIADIFCFIELSYNHSMGYLQKNRFTHKKSFHYIPLQKTMQRASKAMRRGNEKPRRRQPFLRVMQSRFFVTQFFCE